MKRFISFGSIEQFRNIVRKVNDTARYVGEDEQGNTIFSTKELPVVNAIASEKIHGSNASVCYNKIDGFWVQSRKNIITPEKDNAGCALHAIANESIWMSIIEDLAIYHAVDLSTHTVSVYFEWCGGNIQKKSAVSGLSKRAIIFQHFKVSLVEEDEDTPNIWKETTTGGGWVECVDAGIFSIMHHMVWGLEIDFNNPATAQNYMIKEVAKLEKSSYVGRSFGIADNIGEGIVVTFVYDGNLYRFKVKGEKHSATKVKVLKPVDEEVEQKKIDFANYACKAWRLEQMFNEFPNPTIKDMGTFLRNLMADIKKEESDILTERGLELKDVGKKVSEVGRRWYQEQLNKGVGI